MKRRLTCRIAGLFCGSVLMASFCGNACALDRRFELDLRVLDQKIAPAVKERRAPAAPRVQRQKDSPAKSSSSARTSVGTAEPVEGRMSLLRLSPAPEQDGMTVVRSLWERLLPSSEPEGSLQIQTDKFTLRLDTKLYHILPAADGGKIVIDSNRILPPLIKTLIQEKDPSLRFVSEAPSEGKRFYTKLLQSAGFYSVEPDFVMEFGGDPRLSVQADYRIERSPDSLMNNETVLLYTGSERNALPPSLQTYLQSAGFQVIEPERPLQEAIPPHRNRFVQVPAGSQYQMADIVLSALGLKTEAGTAIDFRGWENNGISLTMQLDRSFDYNGKQYALATFDGNPVTYTLTRLMETQGVTVVVLDNQDDFRSVTGKLLDALHLPAKYDLHQLWPLRETSYSLQMSGFMLHDPISDRNIFITEREVTPLLLDLIDRNGYAVMGVQAQKAAQ